MGENVISRESCSMRTPGKAPWHLQLGVVQLAGGVGRVASVREAHDAVPIGAWRRKWRGLRLCVERTEPGKAMGIIALLLG